MRSSTLRTVSVIVCLGLAALSSTCDTTQGTDCPDGVLIEGSCWPRDCTGRDCPEGFFCLEEDCVEEACLEASCPPEQACAGGGCYPRDCAWRTCPGLGEVCLDDECSPASCVAVDCPTGQACAAGRCYPEDCTARPCPGYGEVCLDDECLDRSCVGVRCPALQVCAGGHCYPSDCGSLGCFSAHEVCVEGACAVLPCAGVTCAGGRVCGNGYCYDPDCPDEDCAAAEACVAGSCLPAACAGVECPAEQRCARGECFPSACDGTACADDEVCFEEACLNWNCIEVHCPAGAFCLDGTCSPIRCTSDAECDDQNVCTADTCQPEEGCSYQPQDSTCNDGDSCTMQDGCQDGRCQGLPLDTDGDGHVAATCGGDDCDDSRAEVHPGATESGTGDPSCGNGLDDDCDGLTDLEEAACGDCAQDADCDDGDACNGAETCQGSLCLAGSAPDCDDQNACTQDGCEPVQGCTHQALADGAECATPGCDGLRWQRHVCASGACQGLEPIADCDDGNVCTGDTCDPLSGCGHTPQPDGEECAPRTCQGLIWTRQVCQAGQCNQALPIQDCADGEVCTSDSCDPGAGCAAAPLADGTECGSRYCSSLEWRRQTCQAGACSGYALQQNCNDSNVCTNDACAAASGCSHANNTAACASDSNACTTDVCSAGTCRHNYLGDHASCGALSAQRCCGGSCRDIRSNESHCGGCGAACSGTYTCEDVSLTTSCSPHPTGVSGRCRCGSNGDCPDGQICRTSTPYSGRCAPEGASDCHDRSFVDVSSCPNYCRY